MIAGIAAVPLVFALGGGVDLSTAWRHKAQAQLAADSAVIIAAKYTGTSAAERERLADMYFSANVTEKIKADVSKANLSLVNGSYKYEVDFDIETPFLSLLHVASLKVGVSAISARANIPLDIVLVLDSSGSMQNDNRMTELKGAVKLFLDQFAGATSGDGKVQASLVPFDTQVRLDAATMGVYAGTATNPYATTNCYTIIDTTDRAACLSAQNVVDPVVDCSKLNASANAIDRYVCAPTLDGFKTGTSAVQGACYSIFNCVYYYYTAFINGGNLVVDRRNASLSCWGSCNWSISGSTTRIYSAAVPTPATVPLATKTNGSETANNDLILTGTEVWSGCMIDRTQPYDVQNDAPLSNLAATLYPKANCARNTLLAAYPLTTNLATLKSKVDLMQPSGNTNITIGVQWGMEAFTPTYPLAGANADARTQKVMIVLTDGNNTQNRWDGSSQVAAIDGRTKIACTNAKAMNIELFTVRLIDGNASLLRECATDPDHYFSVNTASELTNTFRKIAERVLRIRIVS